MKKVLRQAGEKSQRENFRAESCSRDRLGTTARHRINDLHQTFRKSGNTHLHSGTISVALNDTSQSEAQEGLVTPMSDIQFEQMLYQ